MSTELQSWESRPLGHPPLEVHRDEDALRLASGDLLEPTIPVGPEEHHILLFVEYERTFGRGHAKYITHEEVHETETGIQTYGAGYLDEYRQLASDYSTAARGTEAEVHAFITRLDDYRAAHPKLYEDVGGGRKPGAPLRIRVVTERNARDVLEE